MWDLTKNHIQLANYPTIVLDTYYTKETIRKTKNIALSMIQLIIVNNLLDFVANLIDLGLA